MGPVTGSAGFLGEQVESIGGKTASEVGASVDATQAATDANTASAIVKRDASGNFSAGTITAAAVVGNVTGNVNGDLAGNATIADAADGLIVGSVPVRAPLPETAAQAQTASGLANVAAWRLDRLNSGNAVSFGDVAATLTANGAIAYQQLYSGRTGINTGVGGTGLVDNLSADVLDPGIGSFLAVARVAFQADPAGTQHNLIGRYKAGAHTLGWRLAVNDSGDLIYEIDDGTNDFTGTLAAGILPSGADPIDVGVQLDRSGADPIARFRWARNGVSLGSTAVTMTGLLTLTSTGQGFGFGAIPNGAPAYYAGGRAEYALVGLGVQCEGSTKLQLAMQGHGFE